MTDIGYTSLEYPSLGRVSLAYLSLGSNLGNRETNLRNAVVRLETAGHVTAVSSFYETEPVEFASQPWFVNCAIALKTSLTPEQLMASLLNIEREMGRQRTQIKGPRTIDIDVLLFGESVLTTEQLTVPHGSMHLRRFVLEPLAEIAPEARHPVLRQTIREMRDALPPGQAVRRLQERSA